MDRRTFMVTAAGLVLPVARRARAQAPLIQVADRPRVSGGVMCGDAQADRALVWARCDRPARMQVEWSTTAAFRDVQRVDAGDALDVDDHTARVQLRGLPAGQDIFYRVRFVDLADLRTAGEWEVGRFRTSPTDRRDVRILWGGDTAGQGWGVDAARGGMGTYRSMAARHADLFIHSGDTVYADAPLQDEVTLPDGSVWRNIVTDAKRKVAETLGEFRGQYAYNLLDGNVRAFNASVSQVWQWDDHEVLNNWNPGTDLGHDARYTEKRVGVLAARARRAFWDYAPIPRDAAAPWRVWRVVPMGPLVDVFVLDLRSHRARNTFNRQPVAGPDTVFLGEEQLAALETALRSSRALWKVLATDMPLGLHVPDGKDDEGRARFENAANGDGAALGRELEYARLLSFLKKEGIRNTVWVTADVHYASAHRYDPARAVFQGFDAFHEFVAPPLHAGAFGPMALDNTFGPTVLFQRVPPFQNVPPSMGYQGFGELQVVGKTGELRVTLRDGEGAPLHETTLAPQRR